MDEYIKIYLSLTRGSGNFRESKDDVAESLAKHYSGLLEKNNIQVAVIWSTLCKNEIITAEDGTKILLWDTNYWMHFSYYYHHLQIIDEMLKEQQHPVFLVLQTEAAWRDLFRVAIPRVRKNSLKHQLLFSKYYLSYGIHSNSQFKFSTLSVIDIANAKWYAFMHELAHITAEPAMDLYKHILRSLFAKEERENIKRTMCSMLSEEEHEYRDALSKLIDSVAEEISNENYAHCQEIIADMRAVHSICTTYISLYGANRPDVFARFRKGILCQRSFNLRIRSIEAHLTELCQYREGTDYAEQILNTQYFREFFLRDRLSDITEQHIIYGTFQKVGNQSGESFLKNYLKEKAYTPQTAGLIDDAIRKHLSGIDRRITDESDISFGSATHQSQEIIDYLLAYTSEKQDLCYFNEPVALFDWNGLIFDLPAEE